MPDPAIILQICGPVAVIAYAYGFARIAHGMIMGRMIEDGTDAALAAILLIAWPVVLVAIKAADLIAWLVSKVKKDA